MTVEELYKTLGELITEGHGNYKVLVSMEMAFTYAEEFAIDHEGKTILIGD